MVKQFNIDPVTPDKGAKNNGIDGVYGPKTANTVKWFQSVCGLTAFMDLRLRKIDEIELIKEAFLKRGLFF
ncbi:hypothetical protein BG616_08940 [Bacillus subtilis]|nr:hypothetical protein BG616_08940 [Bacillus subtilis]